MEIREYQDLAMRTNDGKCNERVLKVVGGYTRIEDVYDKHNLSKILGCNPGELLNGVLGLTGEAGEVADIVKKHIFHGHELDRKELIKELGDVCWYLALLCHALDVPLDVVMISNIEKLRNRYPEGFSETASINRTE